jgi:homoserine/homoserine lactone efflux protein
MSVLWWGSLIVAMFMIAISPGNGAALAMRTSMKWGMKGAFFAVIGLQIGLLSVYVTVLSFIFLGVAFSKSLLTVIGMIGGAYLIYLGIMDLYSLYKFHKHQINMLPGVLANEEVSSNSHQLIPWKSLIINGVVTNSTNPKGILFLVAFFPQWLQVDAPWPLWKQAMVMGIVAVTIDSIVMNGYGFLAKILKDKIKKNSHLIMFQGILAMILVGMGLMMLLVQFQQ